MGILSQEAADNAAKSLKLGQKAQDIQNQLIIDNQYGIVKSSSGGGGSGSSGGSGRSSGGSKGSGSSKSSKIGISEYAKNINSFGKDLVNDFEDLTSNYWIYLENASKDGVKTDGYIDLVETDGTTYEKVSVKSTGLEFNEKLIKEIKNVKIK